MTRAGLLVLGLLVVAPAVARADDTFESKATGAERVRHIEDVVWALTATCDTGDDVVQRQCRHVRDARVTALASATLLVDGDADAFEVAKWNAAKKSVAVALTACIRCGGVELDGKKVYLVGTTAQQRVEDGRLRASRLYDTARGFAGENAANSWITAVRGVRVELLVKVPPKPRWQVGDKTGLALEIVGYRVYSPCSGAVIVANPPSGALPPDKKACGKEPPVVFDPETPAEAVETLSPEMVHDALKPVVEAANTCFAQLNIAGKAKLEITIAGDGTIAKYDQTGDFKSTPTGDCIDRAMTKVRFPPSKKPLTKIGYPLILK